MATNDNRNREQDKFLVDRWKLTGPDADGYAWLDIDDPDGKLSHINLGFVEDACEKMANFLARVDFGE
jgi:hypothetical protein